MESELSNLLRQLDGLIKADTGLTVKAFGMLLLGRVFERTDSEERVEDSTVDILGTAATGFRSRVKEPGF